jgi:hypothetical protein
VPRRGESSDDELDDAGPKPTEEHADDSWAELQSAGEPRDGDDELVPPESNQDQAHH